MSSKVMDALPIVSMELCSTSENNTLNHEQLTIDPYIYRELEETKFWKII